MCWNLSCCTERPRSILDSPKSALHDKLQGAARQRIDAFVTHVAAAVLGPSIVSSLLRHFAELSRADAAARLLERGLACTLQKHICKLRLERPGCCYCRRNSLAVGFYLGLNTFRRQPPWFVASYMWAHCIERRCCVAKTFSPPACHAIFPRGADRFIRQTITETSAGLAHREAHTMTHS